MDGLKKQLEIVFSMNTSTLKMTVEHFKIQQPIIEKNATFGPRSSEEIQLEEPQEFHAEKYAENYDSWYETLQYYILPRNFTAILWETILHCCYSF